MNWTGCSVASAPAAALKALRSDVSPSVHAGTSIQARCASERHTPPLKCLRPIRRPTPERSRSARIQIAGSNREREHAPIHSLARRAGIVPPAIPGERRERGFYGVLDTQDLLACREVDVVSAPVAWRPVLPIMRGYPTRSTHDPTASYSLSTTPGRLHGDLRAENNFLHVGVVPAGGQASVFDPALGRLLLL